MPELTRPVELSATRALLAVVPGCAVRAVGEGILQALAANLQFVHSAPWAFVSTLLLMSRLYHTTVAGRKNVVVFNFLI